jgi:hypothetical protein
LSARGLPRKVARGDMGDAMRQHAGEFGFVLGRQKQRGAHENITAGERQRFVRRVVRAAVGDYGESISESGTGELRGQTLPEFVHIVAGNGGVQGFRMARRLGGKLPAECRFLFRAVEDDTLAGGAVLRGRGQGNH